ncbi:hypothetical protein Tco_1388981 [Tanacetum coccineum]
MKTEVYANSGGKKAFKFANFIADKEEFLPLIKKLWETEYDGCQMFKKVKKLKSLKKDLKKLTWKDGNIFDKVNSLKVQLKDVQTRIDKDPHDKELRLEERKFLNRYVEAMKDEEKLLFQKAKIKWLKEVHVKYTLPLIKKKLAAVDAEFMVRDVCDEEIKDAMFQIEGNKAPGPDGYSSVFFKKA